MLTPLAGMYEPYKIGKRPQLFTDWHLLQAGMVRWPGEGGKAPSLWATEMPWGEATPVPDEVPSGLRLRAQKAEKSAPFLSCTEPWEHMIFYPTLIRDGGKYRLWYEVVPYDHWSGTRTGRGADLPMGFSTLLCYAESDDLVTWRKPALGLAGYHGIAKTNIVLGGELGPDMGYHGGAIFIDPSAPAGERYKAFFMGVLTPEQQAVYKAAGAQLDPMSERHRSAMYVATSPDGLSWKVVPEPVLFANSDTGNTAYYDAKLGKYVAYVRTWYYGRRAVGRSETDDFRHWPMPEPVLWPLPDDAPSTDIYTNSHACYPGSDDYHLMFPAMYLRDVDSTTVRLATSVEGVMWSWTPGEPVIAPGPLAEWDSGCLFAGHGLVAIPDERVAQVYVGYPVPHKYPREQLLGQVAVGSWPSGRLVALEAPERGQFTSAQMLFEGRYLTLNLETKRAGEVLVEVADKDGQPLPGRSFADAMPVTANALRAPVTWKDGSDLGQYAGQPVLLRFRLRAAKLYSFQFDE
ncbi:MAG: hypothetical protein ACUVWR_05420 [Anaerolineae bacterium]